MNAPRGPAVAILSAVRTPIGRFGGSLRTTRAPVLGTIAARGAIERSGVAPEEIEEVLFAEGIQAGVGQNPARQVLRGASIPDSVGAATINMVCGGGMKSILLGFTSVRAGEHDRVLVGGMESMSNAPYLVEGSIRWGSPPGPHVFDDSMQRDSLIDAYGEHEIMGLTGERIARKFKLGREDVDRFGLRSHLRASEAVAHGTFAKELVPVLADATPGGTGLDHDEGPRADTTLEKLSRLKPAFAPNGILTAGNSSKLADGAAALVLARVRFPGRQALSALLFSPLILPAIVMGAAILQYASALGFARTFGAVLVGHTVIVMPYVVRTTLASLFGLDLSFEEAARDLGDTGLGAFFRITLPLIKPGVIAGALFAVIISWINVELSMFNTTAELMTIPVKLFNYIQYSVDPMIAAVSAGTIYVAIVVVIMLDLTVGIDKATSMNR